MFLAQTPLCALRGFWINLITRYLLTFGLIPQHNEWQTFVERACVSASSWNMPKTKCSLQYFSFKSGNQIFGFLLGEHKGSGGRRGGVSTYDKTLNIMHLYIYYINTRPDDAFIHKVWNSNFLWCVWTSKNLFLVTLFTVCFSIRSLPYGS